MQQGGNWSTQFQTCFFFTAKPSSCHCTAPCGWPHLLLPVPPFLLTHNPQRLCYTVCSMIQPKGLIMGSCSTATPIHQSQPQSASATPWKRDGSQTKHPTCGGQTHDQEAAVQWTYHLEKNSIYLSVLMVTTWCSAYLPVFCTQLH